MIQRSAILSPMISIGVEQLPGASGHEYLPEPKKLRLPPVCK